MATNAHRARAVQQHGFLQLELPGAETHRAAGIAHPIDRVLNRELLACVRLGGHAVGATAVMPVTGRWPRMAAIGHGTAPDVPNAQPGVVMVNAARRRVRQRFHRRIRSPCGEHPVVASLEALRTGATETHCDAVLKDQGGAGRHFDHTAGAGVEILEHRSGAASAGLQHGMLLVPATHPQVVLARELGARKGCRNHVCRQRGREGNAARRFVDGDSANFATALRKLALIVDDLDPVVAVKAQHVVAAQ